LKFACPFPANCVASDTCNGKGECKEDDGTCKCEENYFGPNCESKFTVKDIIFYVYKMKHYHYLTKFQHYHQYNAITFMQVGPHVNGLICKREMML
jgi:hypothetical protein